MKQIGVLFIFFACNTLSAKEIQIVLPLKAVPQTLLLEKMTTVEQDYVSKFLVETLFKLDNGFEVNPIIASNIKWVNSKNLQVSLKEKIFSDGSKMTLDQVVDTLNRCVKSSNQTLTTALQSIKGFNENAKTISGIVPDYKQNKVNILLNKESPLITDTLVLTECAVVKDATKTDLYKNSIGTGPYIIASRNDKELVFTKNRFYGSNDAIPDKVVFRAAEKYGNFESMKNDFDLIRSEEDVKDSNFNKYEFYQLGTYKLFLNHAQKPFDDFKVREALVNSIDFDKLFEKMSWDKNLMQEGLFPYGIRGFKRRTIDKTKFEKAFAVLKKLGYSESNKLNFNITISKSTNWKLEEEAWSAALQESLFKPTIVPVEQSELFVTRDNGKFQALRMTKTPGSIEPHRLLSSYLSNSLQNPSHAAQSCDDKIKKSFEILDSEKRYAAYLTAEKCIMDKLFFIPVTSVPRGFIYTRKPWKLKSTSRFNLKHFDISNWYKDEQ